MIDAALFVSYYYIDRISQRGVIMLETCKSIIGLVLVILLAIGGFDQPDAAMSLSGSQWVDENGLVYEFNEDASLFSNNLAGFFYVRMSSGEYQQASMDS